MSNNPHGLDPFTKKMHKEAGKLMTNATSDKHPDPAAIVDALRTGQFSCITLHQAADLITSQQALISEMSRNREVEESGLKQLIEKAQVLIAEFESQEKQMSQNLGLIIHTLEQENARLRSALEQIENYTLPKLSGMEPLRMFDEVLFGYKTVTALARRALNPADAKDVE